ncbi:MAG: PBP1A family penicillin-binding protein [Candidatus Eisenbacteria sp.]|nr:PBP1A family penicillin-binding protein [Candidatus Eisenbacteria bacterium]
MKYFAIALLSVPLLLAAALYGILQVFGQDLPTPRSPHEVESSVATRLIDCTGEPLDELFVEDRVPLHFSEVPPAFIEAILAIEDRQFYRHWGLNPLSILRALKQDIIQGRVAQGASTITQQLARNLFLDHQRTLRRKVREAVLALRLERSFSKDEILELYINKIYFGEGAYGLSAAARRFFGVSAQELPLAQCALLAGMPGNPAAFSPRRHPEASRARRNRVLRAMYATGAIDSTVYHQTLAAPLELVGERAHQGKQGAYFTELVRQELMHRYGASGVYHAGLRVETTLDPYLQRVVEEALESHLRSLEARNQYAYLRGGADSLLHAYGLPPEEELPSRLRLQGAAVVLDPASGAVRAMVGGRNFAESAWNRAVQAPRQPASAFKPFIYAEALRQGYRTTDMLLDAPVEFEIIGVPAEDSVWSPGNFSKTYHGPVTLRFALAKSINVPTARLLAAIGIQSTIAMAHRMGVQSPLPEVLSLATGTGEVNLMELTSAYGVFGNQGIRVAPHLIDRVLDRHGHLLDAHEPVSAQVLDAQTCYLLTSILESTMELGTGQTARTVYGLQMPAAGKTGTNDEYTDAWFIGYTPDFAVGVWVGFDYRIPIGGKHTGTGAMAALPIWARIMKAIEERAPYRDFEIPAGITLARTCFDSGELAAPDCPRVIEDAFITGTEPRETCSLHRAQAEPDGGFRDLDRWRTPQDPWAYQSDR